MKRNFPNFLEAYQEYAIDGFCPDTFHYWTGLSIIAGALERKVWLPLGPGWTLYPNLYVFLVSHPGSGKSSAGRTGVMELLRELPDIKFVPAQITVAKLIDTMSEATVFYDRKDNKLVQSSGYLYASEASNSLVDVYGDLIACLTDFYDCEKVWSRATKKDGETKIFNVCFNLLAGCTFDFLGKLLPESSIMGGFASRNLYVVHDKKAVRQGGWPGGEPKANDALKKKLFEDLTLIHNLSGEFFATDEFRNSYETWFPKHDEYVQSLNSEKLQAFLARKHVNVLKLSMIHAACESDELILTQEHWDKSLAEITDLEASLSKVLHLAAAPQDKQKALVSKLIKLIAQGGTKVKPGPLRQRLIIDGYVPNEIDGTLSYLSKNGIITLKPGAGAAYYELLINPDQYL